MELDDKRVQCADSVSRLIAAAQPYNQSFQLDVGLFAENMLIPLSSFPTNEFINLKKKLGNNNSSFSWAIEFSWAFKPNI
jgi:hypothetical protein